MQESDGAQRRENVPGSWGLGEQLGRGFLWRQRPHQIPISGHVLLRGPAARGRDGGRSRKRGPAEGERAGEIEGTSGLCSPSSRHPAQSVLSEERVPSNRAPPVKTDVAHSTGVAAGPPGAQGYHELVGRPGGSRGGAGNGRGRAVGWEAGPRPLGLLAPVTCLQVTRGYKACSQLPGMQQASQMPAAHTALGRQGPSCEAPRL